MAFSEEIKTKAMVACGRHCCICHKFCGNNMEVHHIRARADGGQDVYENAIPLCFDCHAIVRQYDPRHPKGIKFTEKELIMHRDRWYGHIQQSLSAVEKSPKQSEESNNENIMLHKIDEGKQLLAYIDGTYGISFDQDTQTIEEVKQVGEFVQYIKELMDFNDLYEEPYDRMMTGYNLTQNIKELDAVGFWVFADRANYKIKGADGKVMLYPILVMKIVRKNSQEIINIKYEDVSLEKKYMR